MKGSVNIYCCINSAAIWGVEPYIIQIEADISSGMPYFNMVGLLAYEVKEARERVRTALRNSGENIPSQRITINLSPADRHKEGTGFDLPIAVSVLCAMGRMDAIKLENTLIIGELGLDGEIKPVRGILPIVNMARMNGISRCIIPKENEKEGRIFSDIDVIAFSSLKDVMTYFDENCRESMENKQDIWDYPFGMSLTPEKTEEDYSQIIGQEAVKRALMIAVSGWHNILMVGSPGVGKSMLASRIPTIMPQMSMEERIEVSGIHSICGLLPEDGLIMARPFSAPHHTITTAALIGGGRIPKPGEITTAHKGVLFLDELPEFQPNVLEALRQPLEERVVKIHRTGGSYLFPADCLLVGAMNPCKCGYYPDRNKCNCSEHDIRNYLSRISGPLMDRIDMSVEVSGVGIDELDNLVQNRKAANEGMTSNDMWQFIKKGICFQKERQGDKSNGRLSVEEIRRYCILDRDSGEFMKEAYEKFELSMRGYFKVIKVARTIADLEESEKIHIHHLTEALAYRTSVKYCEN